MQDWYEKIRKWSKEKAWESNAIDIEQDEQRAESNQALLKVIHQIVLQPRATTTMDGTIHSN